VVNGVSVRINRVIRALEAFSLSEWHIDTSVFKPIVYMGASLGENNYLQLFKATNRGTNKLETG